MTVTIQISDRVALVTIDNPPVNALGHAVRAALLDAVSRIEADPRVDAAVLTGAGKLFVGGADITEFNRPPQEPGLNTVIDAIEAATKPWIATLQGAALGGGLELALGCRFRVVAPVVRLGLPEVELGLIPGAGGTQRLPRLIGAGPAIEVITGGRLLGASDAVDLGLADAVIGGPLVEGALNFARARVAGVLPRTASDRPLSVDAEVWEAAEARLRKSARGNAAPFEALAVMRLGAERGVTKGRQAEAATFQRLRASESAAALRYLFFAERAAPRPAALKGIDPLPLAQVGVVGGGTMGAGIAAAMLMAGLSVTLSERDADALDRGLTNLRGLMDAAMRRGRLTEAQAGAHLSRLSGVEGLAGLAPCDLVIEAVFEDLDLKRAVFAELGRICRTDAVLATNTSFLDPREIAEGLPHPERFLGLHFFSPAQVMKLLEIVPTPQTSPQVLSTGFALARRLGKIPVQAGICDGFIGNRILRRYRAEAEALLRQGIPPDKIDAAIRGFGFAMGIFEMQDMAGLDISFMLREAARARGEHVPLEPGDLLVRAGRKGQKTGGGWYDYAPGDRRPQPSAEAARLIAPLVTGALSLSQAEIAARLVGAMADEGKAILDEGIAASASDIDLVEVHGYGFPRVKGGPMFLASRRETVPA